MSRFPASWVHGGWAPTVCAPHGEPATARLKTAFRSSDRLGAEVVARFTRVPVAIVVAPAWPWCPACLRRRRAHLLIGGPLAVLGFAAFASVGLIRDDPAFAGLWPVLLWGGIVALVAGMLVAARGKRVGAIVSADGVWVDITGAERFHAQVAAQAAALQSGTAS